MTEKREDRGGGPLPRTIDLTEDVARWLKQRAALTDKRYRRADASAAANAIFEAIASGATLPPASSDMLAALPFLQDARRMCFHEDAQRGLDQLIAALWAAQNARDA